MSRVRFILVGGFLGAGKTTTIARLARAYREQGQKIGIVTNDQATDLVDTHSLRAAGFDVGEVAGSCFCCNFSGLADAVAQLETITRLQPELARRSTALPQAGPESWRRQRGARCSAPR